DHHCRPRRGVRTAHRRPRAGQPLHPPAEPGGGSLRPGSGHEQGSRKTGGARRNRRRNRRPDRVHSHQERLRRRPAPGPPHLPPHPDSRPTHHRSSLMIRNIGLAPLSALTTPSDELIRMAANAGFSFVGLRVLAVTPDEPHYDLAPGSPLLNRTLRALDETGLHVVDTEFLQVNAHTDRDTWLPALEAAGALGATRFTVAAGDE